VLRVYLGLHRINMHHKKSLPKKFGGDSQQEI